MVGTKLAGLLASLLMAAGLIGFVPSAAHADPNYNQQASVKISGGEARHVTQYVTRVNFKQMLSGPIRWRTVGTCYGGPKLWKCPATVANSETKCTMDVWVWADDYDSYYYEWHDLVCQSRR